MRNVLLLLLILAWAANSKANLLQNGDFETTPSATPPDIYIQNINNPTTYTLNNWTFGRTFGTGGSPRLEWYSTTSFNSWQNAPQSGTYAIQLNSDSSTDLIYAEQTFTVTQLIQHTLTFYYNSEIDYVAAAGVRVSITGIAGSVAFSSNTPQNSWQFVTYTFTPTTVGSTTIRFTDDPVANQGQNVLLDNISIVVPEPSTYAMGILLVLTVGGFHYWRRREA